MLEFILQHWELTRAHSWPLHLLLVLSVLVPCDCTRI